MLALLPRDVHTTIAAREGGMLLLERVVDTAITFLLCPLTDARTVG